MRILLIEDDSATAQSIQLMLKSEGYICDTTDLGEDGLEIGKLYDYDIMILDLMLPDIDGYEVVRRLREARVETPILILSGLNEADNKVKGLGVGADDYLTKPFDPEELVLRVRNLLYRTDRGPMEKALRERTEIFRFEGWTLDAGAHSLTGPDDNKISLTRGEFNLLAALARAPNRVLSRDRLLDAVSQDADAPTDRLIDVLVSRVRKKIEKNPKKPEIITTVVGCGYKFSAEIS